MLYWIYQKYGMTKKCDLCFSHSVNNNNINKTLLELKVTKLLLIYAGDMQKHKYWSHIYREAIVDAGMKVGLEVNTGITKYMFLPNHQNA